MVRSSSPMRRLPSSRWRNSATGRRASAGLSRRRPAGSSGSIDAIASLVEADQDPAGVEIDVELTGPADRGRGSQARFEHGDDGAEHGDDVGDPNVQSVRLGRLPAEPCRRTAQTGVTGGQAEANPSPGTVGVGANPVVEVSEDGGRGLEPVDAPP